MTYRTGACLLTSHVDVGEVGCPPQDAVSPTWWTRTIHVSYGLHNQRIFVFYVCHGEHMRQKTEYNTNTSLTSIWIGFIILQRTTFCFYCHLYLYSAFNNTDCVKALNSIKLEDRVSVMYNNKIKHSIFS